MRPTAQLNREIAHPQHSHLLPILLAKKRQGAPLERFGQWHLLAGDLGILTDVRVNQILDALKRLVLHRAGVGEVKAQPVRGDQRACLAYMCAQDLAQGRVQDMRG